MHQIETDLRSPVPPQVPLTPPRFDAEQYFAEGGPAEADPEPRPLTIYRRSSPRELAAGVEGPEVQSPIEGERVASPSMEGFGQALGNIGEGVNQLYKTPPLSPAYTAGQGARRSITPQMLAANLDPEAQGASSPSLEGVGQGMVAMGEDPAALIGGMLPGIGNVMAAADVSKLKDKIAQLRAAGDDEGASRLQKILPLAAMGAVMPVGGGLAARSAIKGAEAGAARAAERELSNMGLYSHAAEVAEALPQAKGSPQQMKAMLKGVKKEELAGFDEAFGDKKSVTRDEIAQHFRDQMPAVEETVLGSQANKYPYRNPDEWQAAISRAERSRNFDEAERLNLAWDDFEGVGQQGAPKFQKYTLPGGENYREVLLKSPEEMRNVTLDEINAQRKKISSMLPSLTQDEYDAMLASNDIAKIKANPDAAMFRSRHWDDPNVLAHLRMVDRTGPNGEKILHVEEIQSDWGQKGKKEGFKGEPVDLSPFEKANEEARIAAINANREMIERESGGRFNSLTNVLNSGEPDLIARVRAARASDPVLAEVKRQAADAERALVSARNSNRSGVPTAPYVTSTEGWTDLALKRALKEAAEGGYDKLVWTPGAEQAKRYKLSNHVNAIDYMREGEDAYRLGITNKQGEGIDLPKDVFTAKELEDYLGKEVAQKIIADEGKSYRGRNHKTLEGLDLEVGGKGMKGYYDKIVPNQLSKLVKKLDPEAKVEMGRLPVQGETRLAPDIARELGMTVEEIQALPHEQRSALINSVRHSIAAPSLTITPKMRESIMKGQTAFADGGPVHAFADGGPVDLPEQVSLVAHDIARIARKDHLDQRHLAYLLKVASGMYMPPERAMEFAGQIMLGDTEGLISRFKTYRPSIRTFARLNQMMGGKHKFMSGDHMGGAMMRMKGEAALMKTKENAESMMDSDVVKSRPAMKKALEAFNKRI